VIKDPIASDAATPDVLLAFHLLDIPEIGIIGEKVYRLKKRGTVVYGEAPERF
jgi:hypothetical protein